MIIINEPIRQGNNLKNTYFTTIIPSHFYISASRIDESMTPDNEQKFDFKKVVNPYISYSTEEFRYFKVNNKTTIAATSYNDFLNNYGDKLKEESHSLKELQWLHESSINFYNFQNTAIASQLNNIPDKFRTFIFNAALGKNESNTGFSEDVLGKIGWALISNGAKLLPLESKTDSNNNRLLIVSILFPSSQYSKDVIRLEFNESTGVIKLL